MKDLDWSNLSFGYLPTDYNVRCYYRNGKWGEIEICSDAYLKLHMAAICLHYGQAAFEGLKAYRCPDGRIRVFRMDENAARLQATGRGILMPEVPTELFEEEGNGDKGGPFESRLCADLREWRYALHPSVAHWHYCARGNTIFRGFRFHRFRYSCGAIL